MYRSEFTQTEMEAHAQNIQGNYSHVYYRNLFIDPSPYVRTKNHTIDIQEAHIQASRFSLIIAATLGLATLAYNAYSALPQKAVSTTIQIPHQSSAIKHWEKV